MTHEVVNSIVKDPPSSFASIQELIVQGVANLLTGMFGGLGGSALIGETVINVLHGARGRVSCVVAGLTMLAIMESLGPVVKVSGRGTETYTYLYT
jgi:SulP family sulfate permease